MKEKLDTNNNGYVDYTEFIAGCMKSKIYLNEEHLKNSFAYFDKVGYDMSVICIGFKWFHY